MRFVLQYSILLELGMYRVSTVVYNMYLISIYIIIHAYLVGRKIV